MPCRIKGKGESSYNGRRCICQWAAWGQSRKYIFNAFSRRISSSGFKKRILTTDILIPRPLNIWYTSTAVFTMLPTANNAIFLSLYNLIQASSSRIKCACVTSGLSVEYSWNKVLQVAPCMATNILIGQIQKYRFCFNHQTQTFELEEVSTIKSYLQNNK